MADEWWYSRKTRRRDITEVNLDGTLIHWRHKAIRLFTVQDLLHDFIECHMYHLSTFEFVNKTRYPYANFIFSQFHRLDIAFNCEACDYEMKLILLLLIGGSFGAST